MSLQRLRECWFLAGPTAGGKTATALELARRINAEVVSMDSMAVYRGMDIGTAKATPEEQALVPHHLLDLADPHEDFSVTQFVTAAQSAVDQILARGAVPLFVGGTGLYLRSLLRGVFQGPEADWTLRQKLSAEATSKGNQWLHEKLSQCDPVTANKLHPNDQRRVIRALEVFELTGQPLSDLQNERPLPPEQRPAAVFWIDPPREWLYERINLRVDRMMELGLLQEVEELLKLSPPPGRTARQALGYRELIAHLEDGVDLEAAIDQIKTGSRQFAKRQHTWFRNMEECRALTISGQENPADLAEEVIRQSSTS